MLEETQQTLGRFMPTVHDRVRCDQVRLVTTKSTRSPRFPHLRLFSQAVFSFRSRSTIWPIIQSTVCRSACAMRCAISFFPKPVNSCWAANKRFEISKFKFKFPRALNLRNDRARSRLYRSQILQVNTRWKALAEIYTMQSFAPFRIRSLISIFFVKHKYSC